LALPRFYAALRGLERRQRSEPVRILWYGDSHTAADYWPDVLRRTLAKRFGSGGPGFLRLGLKTYRHGAADVDRGAAFRREPNPPSVRLRQDDGIFGLGGMRTLPEAGSATASVRPRAERIAARARHQLLFRLSPGDRLELELGQSSVLLNAKSKVEHVAGSPIARWTLEGAPMDKLTVRASGAAQLFGVIVESSVAGVVVDTLGIDGARAETPLAWDEAAFAAEVGARNPSLVIVAYGTNEVFDQQAPQKYFAHLTALLAKIRRGAPDSDCLIVGPPDAADASYASHPRVAEITLVHRRAAAELKCAFFSAAAAMGGPGGFGEWLRHKPPLAKTDRVHLTREGYERLGEALAKALMEGYRP
jgi:lysophospholipase L1-like esterase